jgi:hypothetical protein
MVVSVKQVSIVVGLALAGAFQAGAQGIEHRVTSGQLTRPAVTSAPSHSTSPTPAAKESSAAPTVPDFRELDPKRDNDLSRASTNEEHTLPGLRALQTTKTPFMTESRLPLAQSPGARVQLNFFVTSINNRNLMAGPNASPETIHPLGQPRSGDLYGVGISVPLGREAGSTASKGLLHGISRFVHGR